MRSAATKIRHRQNPRRTRVQNVLISFLRRVIPHNACDRNLDLSFVEPRLEASYTALCACCTFGEVEPRQDSDDESDDAVHDEEPFPAEETFDTVQLQESTMSEKVVNQGVETTRN